MSDDERLNLPSASSMERLYHCPGSRALEATAPKRVESQEAIEGTLIAKALEEANLEGLDENGKNIAQRLSEMEQQAVDDWCYEKDVPASKLEVIRERRFWVRDPDTMGPIASAKPDVVISDGSGRLGLVINHKTGYLPVPAAHMNIQCRTEAVAVWDDHDDGLTDIRAAIAQYRFRGKFTATDFDTPYLKMAKAELRLSLWRGEQSDQIRVPGHWCLYCRAKGFCPEAQAMTMLPAVPMPTMNIAKKDIPSAVATLDLPRLAFLRHKKSMIENILEEVSDRLRHEFTPEVLASVYLRLVPSVGVKTLSDIQATWRVLFANGVTEDEFKQVCKTPYGAVQELLVTKILAKEPTMSGTDAQKLADEILKPVVHLVPRDPQLRSLL